MVFSTMSELCSEFDSSRDDTVFLSYVCSVYRVRRRRRESRRCRDAPVDAPPENLPRETHDPESAVPRSEHSDVDVHRLFGGKPRPPFQLSKSSQHAPRVIEPIVSPGSLLCFGGGGLYRWWRTPDSAGILEIASPRSRDRRSPRNAEDSHSRLSRAARRIRPLVRTHTRTSRRRLDVSELRARRPL
jgi:hypothetical protein